MGKLAKLYTKKDLKTKLLYLFRTHTSRVLFSKMYQLQHKEHTEYK